MVPLKPHARKWANFDESGGVPITLADGNVWIFPMPKFGPIIFRRDKSGKTAARRSLGWDGYDAVLDAFMEAEDGEAALVAQFDLAYALLSQNYEISPDEAGRYLLTVARDDDPEFAVNERMWTDIISLAMGQPPKVTPVGSEQP